MDTKQIAAQLYTVRDHVKTAAEFAASLGKLRRIGYRAVELAGLGEIAEEEAAAMLAREGLACCSSHENAGLILERPQAVIEKLRKLGCKCVAVSSPGGVEIQTLEDVMAFAARLNAAGKVFHEAGMVFAYHNHSGEFRRFGGRLMLDVLYEETDPRYLQGQPDTYWVQYGGGDSEDWCRKLKGRLPMVHLKDYAVTREGPIYAEIGRGNLNWKAIIAAAEQSGCQWYIVEQDQCAGDPFDSLRISFDYLRDNLCS